ncbi:hypothetical protein BG011_008734 [Mortierella polycephala]|uniref:U1 small nuclear ribonucleoprotein C n=1 Tax=Mortierella polycephala TaxID=41804 RepID=A0A9P6PMF1_9FUNG|nr:hypothetical protein BG011_008734 [Mortierella polycephala]
MPKYYCDYCDIFLTHDSSSVRKAHNAGRNHLINVKTYYSELSPESTGSVLEAITKAYAESGAVVPPQYSGYPQIPTLGGHYNPYGRPSFPGMPPNGMPPRPPHPSMFMRPPPGAPGVPPHLPPPPPGFPAGAPFPPPGAPFPPSGAPFPPGQMPPFPPGQFPPPGFRPPFPPAGIPPPAPGSAAPPASGPGPVMNSDRKRRLEESRD